VRSVRREEEISVSVECESGVCGEVGERGFVGFAEILVAGGKIESWETGVK